MARVDQIRASLRQAYPGHSEELIDALVELNESLVLPCKARRWTEARCIVSEWCSHARERLRDARSHRVIKAESLMLLAHLDEQLGDRRRAVAALEELLRMRIRFSGSRASLYEQLVDLLVAENLRTDALRWAQRGYRFSRERDPISADALKQRIDQLREPKP